MGAVLLPDREVYVEQCSIQMATVRSQGEPAAGVNKPEPDSAGIPPGFPSEGTAGFE